MGCVMQTGCPYHDLAPLSEDHCRLCDVFTPAMSAGIRDWQFDPLTETVMWRRISMTVAYAPHCYATTPLAEFLSYMRPKNSPRHRVAIARHYETAIFAGTAGPYRLQFDFGEGERTYESFAQVTFEGGRPARICGVLRDCSSEIEAQGRSEAALALMETVASHVQTGIMIVGRDKRIRKVNARFNEQCLIRPDVTLPGQELSILNACDCTPLADVLAEAVQDIHLHKAKYNHLKLYQLKRYFDCTIQALPGGAPAAPAPGVILFLS